MAYRPAFDPRVLLPISGLMELPLASAGSASSRFSIVPAKAAPQGAPPPPLASRESSRSPRRPREEENAAALVQHDSSFDLSIELSRVIDVRAECETEILEYRHKCLAELRGELEQYESTLVIQHQQEIASQQASLEHTSRENEARGAEQLVESRAGLQQHAAERNAALRNELEQYAAALRDESRQQVEQHQARVSEQIAAHFSRLYRQEFEEELAAQRHVMDSNIQVLHHEAQNVQLATRAECRLEIMSAAAKADVVADRHRREQVELRAMLSRAEVTHDHELAQARLEERSAVVTRDGRHTEAMAEVQQEAYDAWTEHYYATEEADTRAQQCEVGERLLLQTRAELEETAKATEEFAEESNAILLQWRRLAETSSESARAEALVAERETAVASGLREELAQARRAAIGVALPVPPPPRPCHGAARPAPDAQAKAKASRADAGVHSRVVSVLTTCGYTLKQSAAAAVAASSPSSTALPPAPPTAVPPRPVPALPARGQLQVFSLAAQDSDTEDDDEAFMRRRTTPKQMDLGVLPQEGSLRKWVNDLIAEAVRCSNRSKTRTLKFIQAALAANSPSEVQRVSSRWDAFDTELSCALLKIAKGAIGREVLLHQEQCLRDMRTATGKELLVIIVRRYELTYGQALQVDTQTLMSLSWKGKLEEFLDSLDASLSRMTREPDDALLLTVVEPLLRQAPELEMDFNIFDRAAPDSFESTLDFLYTAARAACERKRRRATLQAMLPAPPKKVAPIIKPKPPGGGKGKDDGKGKDNGKGKDKGKGKAKGKGAGDAHSGPPARQLPCKSWRTSKTCVHGDDCRYVHVDADKLHTPTKAYPAGVAITAMVPGAACTSFAAGRCGFGNTCFFRHGHDDRRDFEALYEERQTYNRQAAKAKSKAKAKSSVMLAAAPPDRLHACGELWTLDTGSAIDATALRPGAKLQSLSDPHLIATGNGEAAVEDAELMQFDELGQTIEAVVLPEAAADTRLLTIGRRCAELGFGFYWRPHHPVPQFVLPTGADCKVVCDQDYVPYIERSTAGQDGHARKVLVGTGASGHNDPTPASRDGGHSAAPATPAIEVTAPLDRPESPFDWFAPFDDAPSPEPQPEDPDAVCDEIISNGTAIDVLRILEGGLTRFDDDSLADPTLFLPAVMEEQDQTVEVEHGEAHLTFQHLSDHLPSMPDKCYGCRAGKHAKSPSKRRDTPGMAITRVSPSELPFGTCVHLDHAVMPHGSPAASVAKFCLHMLDERTKFAGGFPAASRSAATVLAAHHAFDDPVPQIRRWWTDNAPEFRLASRRIREQRPFGHFTSVPHVPQTNGVIERFNRTVLEGTMALLSMACFPSTWWPLALQCWIMMWNGFHTGPDGLTPYHRRFGRPPDYKQYPFGALVFVHPRQKDTKAPKMEHRMLPYVFIGVGIGPSHDWSRVYAVVPLRRLLGEHRPSRSTVRYSGELFFPERITFPCKQRLHLAGAVRDASFPAPAIADEGQKWEIEGSDRGASEDECFDGEGGENAPFFRDNVLLESLEIDDDELDPVEVDAPPAAPHAEEHAAELDPHNYRPVRLRRPRSLLCARRMSTSGFDGDATTHCSSCRRAASTGWRWHA